MRHDSIDLAAARDSGGRPFNPGRPGGPAVERGPLEPPGRSVERGHALLIIVVTIAIMIVSTTVAMKVWSTVIQREKEEELIFRGKQYGLSIRLYQKMKGTFPTDLKQLADKGPNNESIIR